MGNKKIKLESQDLKSLAEFHAVVKNYILMKKIK